LSYTAKTSIISEQISAYQKLERHIANYRKILVLSFDGKAGEVFQNLRKHYPRLGTMDLKIAAIAIANQSTLLTRNTKDFSQITNLSIEDWTA
jgi:tRNA(fMet)-specific endonuclease VapC